MAYNKAMKCLPVKTSKSTEHDERIHGGLLLLNELLRVSDVEFEVKDQIIRRIFLLMVSLE